MLSEVRVGRGGAQVEAPTMVVCDPNTIYDNYTVNLPFVSDFRPTFQDRGRNCFLNTKLETITTQIDKDFHIIFEDLAT